MLNVMYGRYKFGQKQGNIFGVKTDSTSTVGVLRYVRERIDKKRKFYIVTPNPEILVRAKNDKILHNVINKADVSLADGIGVVMATKFLSMKAPNSRFIRILVLIINGFVVGISLFLNKPWLTSEMKVVRGREMFVNLCKLANKKGWRVYLFGGESDEAELAKDELKKTLKKIKLRAENGPMLDQNGNPGSKADSVSEKQAIVKINKFKPHLLFLAFSPPKQEKWLSRWYKSLDIGGAMVVGGAFNYVSGRSKIPPKILSDFGLEWLWRLITEPWRCRRIATALLVFPYHVFVQKLESES